MKPLRTFLLLALLTGAIAAMAGKPRQPKPDAAQIDTLAYLPPFAHITFMDDDTATPEDDSVGAVAARLLGDAIDSFGPQMRIGPLIPIADGSLRRTRDAVFGLFEQARKHPTQYHGLTVPPVLDSLLAASGQRYVLLAGIGGMTRTQKNFRQATLEHIPLDVAFGALAPGRVKKTTCFLDAIIIDVERHNLYYNRFTLQEEVNPTNRKVVYRKFKSLFDRFFWPGPVNTPL